MFHKSFIGTLRTRLPTTPQYINQGRTQQTDGYYSRLRNESVPFLSAASVIPQLSLPSISKSGPTRLISFPPFIPFQEFVAPRESVSHRPVIISTITHLFITFLLTSSSFSYGAFPPWMSLVSFISRAG